MDQSKDSRIALKDALRKIQSGMRITKTVCTRSVKGRYGDTYVGFSAAWDTIQDDAGGGGDMISSQDGDVVLAHRQGLTLKESRLASLVLALQADVSAHNHAMAGGNISEKDRNEAIKAIKNNYTKLMLAEMEKQSDNGGTPNE